MATNCRVDSGGFSFHAASRRIVLTLSLSSFSASIWSISRMSSIKRRWSSSPTASWHNFCQRSKSSPLIPLSPKAKKRRPSHNFQRKGHRHYAGTVARIKMQLRHLDLLSTRGISVWCFTASCVCFELLQYSQLGSEQYIDSSRAVLSRLAFD